jgi:hypothetical protein
MFRQMLRIQIGYQHRIRVSQNMVPDRRIGSSGGSCTGVDDESRADSSIPPCSLRFGASDMAAVHDTQFHGPSGHGNI